MSPSQSVSAPDHSSLFSRQREICGPLTHIKQLHQFSILGKGGLSIIGFSTLWGSEASFQNRERHRYVNIPSLKTRKTALNFQVSFHERESVNFYISSKIILKTHIPVFTVELLTIPRTWKQPICPLADEVGWKLGYRYTKDCYSALKRNVLKSVLMRWNESGAYYTEWS